MGGSDPLRYRNAGKLEFKKYGKLTALPVPGSSVLQFGRETYKSFLAGTGCMAKIEDVKIERDCGAMCPEGLIPDVGNEYPPLLRSASIASSSVIFSPSIQSIRLSTSVRQAH